MKWIYVWEERGGENINKDDKIWMEREKNNNLMMGEDWGGKMLGKDLTLV